MQEIVATPVPRGCPEARADRIEERLARRQRLDLSSQHDLSCRTEVLEERDAEVLAIVRCRCTGTALLAGVHRHRGAAFKRKFHALGYVLIRLAETRVKETSSSRQ